MKNFGESHSDGEGGIAAGRPPTRWTQLGMLAATCFLVVGVYAYTANLGKFEPLFADAAGEEYNLLVEGFRDGQLNLKRAPPPGFTQLADPYDPASNVAYRAAAHSLYDLSYYKGKLYLYFGVTPSLLLFWPYVLLTGNYLLHRRAVVIFCSLGFLASVYLLREVWRRYFPEVDVLVMVACALALGLASGVTVMLSRCKVYEVPISCGYMLTMMALAALWKAIHEPEHRCQWLAVASVAYGLAVGARPSLLFGAVILLVPLAQSRCERRRVWTLLIAAIGPITVIGLGLMLYNYMRFDNPFEFGLRYQLAGERQDAREFLNLRYLWFNFRLYFLEPLHWGGHFPFVQEVVAPPLPVGYVQVEKSFGVLSSVPLVWLALAVPLAWRIQPGQTGPALRRFAVAVTLLFGICAFTLGLLNASASRYEVDFLPALIFLAVIGIFGLERALTSRPVWRRMARWIWGLLLGVSVAFNLLASVGQYAEGLGSLGFSLIQSGRMQEAIEVFEKSVQLKPDFVRGHYNLGNALAQQGRSAEAASQWEEVLRLRPDLADAHYRLGNALFHLGRKQEALGQWDRVLQLQPDSTDAQNDMAWALATLPPAEGGNPARAVQLAQQACQRTSNRAPQSLDTLAVAYAANNQFRDAITTAQKAIELAGSTGQTQLVTQIEMRLKLYRTNRTYHP